MPRTVRRAIIHTVDARAVAQYLPDNYRLVESTPEGLLMCRGGLIKMLVGGDGSTSPWLTYRC